MELKPGIDLLGPVEETFFDIYDLYEPNNDHTEDNCFISAVSISVHSLLCEAWVSYHFLQWPYLTFLIDIGLFCRVMMHQHTLNQQ